MKIVSDAESAGIKLIIAILVITLIVVCFWKQPKNNYTIAPHCDETDTLIVHDTVWKHDTIIDVHPITRTIHDTIYIQ